VSDAAARREAAAVTQTLALLNEQVDQVRAELERVRRDLAEAQRDYNGSHAGQLLQANEQLVLAALRAETTAETAVSSLGELAQSSQRDPLTGTPNRALMLDRLQNAAITARRHGTRMAVLFLDLDTFKQINDTLGHAAGDEVLQLVARRLESIVRASDTVSRHSGDEFLVLLSELAHASDAAVIAGKMLAAVAEPGDVGGQVIRLSASVGIAIYPDDGKDSATLIDRADTAMYRAKRRGRDCFESYSQ
jgi:diguanylate cyclase (GGDEF)-like protein